MNGKLYIIPTPIGNLADITLRALETLKKMDIVYAEDTRQALKLFKHYQIETPLKSYHQYNEHSIKQSIIKQLKQGNQIGLVSDAGTPGISDPGFLIVRECLKNDIEVECLPGATALIPAIVVSGFPCERFVFEGFLPHKKGRKKKIQEIAESDTTCVLYESPHRIIKTLKELHECIGNEKPVCVCRELTKLHESIYRGSFQDVIETLEKQPVKGEIVIVVGKRHSFLL